jgi:hypothetical protein
MMTNQFRSISADLHRFSMIVQPNNLLLFIANIVMITMLMIRKLYYPKINKLVIVRGTDWELLFVYLSTRACGLFLETHIQDP